MLDLEAYFITDIVNVIPSERAIMKPTTYLRIVRSSAWYDLLVTWPFATPWTFGWLYDQLARLASTAGIPGVTPPLDAMHLLLANLLGSAVIAWSLARMLSPSIRLGRLDAMARWLFLCWQIVAVSAGANAIILLFSSMELLFGILQSLPVRPGIPDNRRDA